MVAVPLPHPTSEWSNCCRRRSISHVHWGVNLLTTRSFPFVELIVWCVTYLMRDLFESWRLISNQLTIVIVHNSEALGDATKRKERHTGKSISTSTTLLRPEHRTVWRSLKSERCIVDAVGMCRIRSGTIFLLHPSVHRLSRPRIYSMLLIVSTVAMWAVRQPSVYFPRTPSASSRCRCTFSCQPHTCLFPSSNYLWLGFLLPHRTW